MEKHKTEHKLPDKKSLDMVTQFKNIYDISPGIICTANANTGIFIECNKAVTSILGWSVKEFTSKPFNEFIHPNDQQKTVDTITEQLKGKPVANFENRYRCKDESYKWLAWQATAADKSGQVYAVATDITDRKQAEKELSISEEKFKFVSDNLQEGLWITDDEDRMIYYNKKMVEISGVSKQDVIGLSIIKDFPKETTQHFLPYYKIAKKELKPNYYEADVVTPVGRKTIQSGWLIPRNQDGKYFGMVCTIEDITERKHTEEKLKESENKYRTLFESSSDAMFISESDTMNILYANQSTVNMYGYDSDELIGMSSLKFSAEVEKSISASGILKKEGKVNIPIRYHKKKDGSIFPVEVHGYKITLGGKVALFVVTRDITKRKKAEEKLLSRNKELEAWAEVTTDRELFMLELKKEINELLKKYGEKPKYKIPV